jgi:hypothetical protein
MAVIEDRDSAEYRYQVTGGQGIQVIGYQQVSFSEEQKQKQPEIVAGIEQGSLPEQQAQTADLIILLERDRTSGEFAADQQHPGTLPHKAPGRPAEPLIGDQVIGYRHHDSFAMNRISREHA